ncbi:MAG: ATP-binding cassette domain-containing protein [Anaerovibrio slackiae]|uniref:ATP-binding cassette domain-containing protein n=1 Tax=Anaerovibrio slackiae TaxID=2652309 RepID=UPI0023F138B4|nr:ATP-binding cassette domain-containing protein [Anaerovibrio slackiae]MDD6164296.1 ATP-binding cassette domain-containing protein [Anaerovibrio slackiae]
MKKFLRFCYNQIPVRERAATLVAALFEHGCILLAAYAAAMLIDGMAGERMLADAGWRYLLLLAAALAVQAVCGALGRYLLSGISERVRLSCRKRLHRLNWLSRGQGRQRQDMLNRGQGLQKQDMPNKEQGMQRQDMLDNAGLAAYCCQHVDALDEFFQKVVPLVLAGLIRLPLFLAVFLYLDAVSGLIAFVTMPVAPVMLYLLGRLAAGASAEQWDRQSELNRGFYELMQGVVTLKLFRRTAAALREMEDLARHHSESSLRVLRIAFLSAFAVELLTTLSIAVLAVGIGLRVLAGSLDFATGFLVLLLAPEFFMPVRSAGMAFHVLMNTRAALQELAEAEKIGTAALALAGAEGSGTASKMLAGAEGSGTGSKMLAGAGESGNHALKLPGGTFAVVTGSSGAGKTTLLRRMAGLLPPAGWQFLLAGYDLGALPEGTRQKIIGYVPQEPHVYAASLRDNLLLGRDFPDGELVRVLELAGLGSWYRRQAAAGGMEAKLGDGGISLSNGQRHRLGLARAMLGSPSVLLLDEVTAGLEPHEEGELLDMLRQWQGSGRVVVLATHRQQAVSRADRVIAVEAEPEIEKVEIEAEIEIEIEIESESGKVEGEVGPCL